MSIFQTGFAKLFGFELKGNDKIKAKQAELKKNEIIEIENDDASGLVDAQYAISSQVNIQDSLKKQADLINEYRMMALHPEVDYAIDDIINAAISCDEDEDPVELDMEKLVDLSETTKDKITDEFEYILNLLDFNHTAYERFRQWYVDGRQVFHVVVDPDKQKEGIQKLVPLDPRATRKFIEYKKTMDQNGVEKISEVEEYYVYDKTFASDSNTDVAGRRAAGQALRKEQMLKMTVDSIVQIHSGVLAADNSAILSNLEKARKPLNNLKMLEDAVIVYHLVRAPERRLFYIDTGSLPKKSAEEYLQMIMNRYKTKLVYDSTSGTISGTPHQMSMNEDFWLPVREGGSGTKVDTLQGGDWDAIDELNYFLRKLYKSLNVPQSRLEQQDVINIGGAGAEITRDEWKFDKFVRRLRRRFSELFTELLRRQLVMKNITSQDDWDSLIAPNLRYKYSSDAYMKDQREAELFNDRIATLSAVDELVGKYFSREYVIRHVLQFNDEQMKEEQDKIKKEIAAGLYLDPIQLEKDAQNAQDEQENSLPPPVAMTTPGFAQPEFNDS